MSRPVDRAKAELYVKLLDIDNDAYTDSDLEIMMVLMVDPYIRGLMK